MKKAREFYFLRHATTDAHVQKKLCGRSWDLPLNEAGFKLAQETALATRARLSSVGLICTSPLTRARQTGETFAEVLRVPMLQLEQLAEWDLGEWDRQPYDAVPELFTRPDPPPGGEPQALFRSRVARGLELALQNAADRTLLMIAHGGVWFALAHVLGIERALPHPAACAPMRFSRAENADSWEIEAPG